MANSWTYTRLTGNKGESGDGLTVQYAATSTGAWHNTFTTGDLYMRQSTNGGTTWSESMRIVGEQGEPGTAGHSPVVTATKSGTTTTIKVDGVTQATVNDGSAGSPGATALQPKQEFASQYTTVGQTASWATSNFNRTPVVGDTFLNVDAGSNLGTWQITAVSNGTATFKLLSCMKIANGTFIANLFSQFIKIGTGGAIIGGDRYVIGQNGTWGYGDDWGHKNGFLLMADGTFKGRITEEFGSLYMGTNSGYTQHEKASGYIGNLGILENSLYKLTEGIHNISIGKDSLYWLTTGYYNVAIGNAAGHFFKTGSENVIIGHGADVAASQNPSSAGNDGGDGNVVIGANAYKQGNTDSDVIIGQNAYTNTPGTDITGEVVIGRNAAVASTSHTAGNVVIGKGAQGGVSQYSDFKGNVVIGNDASVTGASGGVSDVILIGNGVRLPTAASYNPSDKDGVINIGDIFKAVKFRWKEDSAASFKFLQTYTSSNRDYTNSNVNNNGTKTGLVALLPLNTFIGEGSSETAYSKVIGVKSYYFSETSSYIKYTNGLIIQWGKVTATKVTSNITYTTIKLPIAFTSIDTYFAECTSTPADSAVNHCCAWDTGRSDKQNVCAVRTYTGPDVFCFAIGY